MREFVITALVGFVAQLIDGVLSMGYGVTASTFLLWAGLPPSVASASVHAAEVVTTGLSGASHLGFGNVDRAVARKLMVPGVLGAIAGAYLLVSFPGESLRPWIAGYLLVMGILILVRFFRRPRTAATLEHEKTLLPLGLAGGFCDAIGGGGWGPIVVGTLVARGNSARVVIGSASLAEFFVTLAASVTFILTIGLSHWEAIAGLAVGGAVAAPLAAWTARHVPARPLLALVGVMVILLSLRTMWIALR